MSTGRSVLALSRLIINSLEKIIGQARSLYAMQGALRFKRFVHYFGCEFLHSWG